MEGKGLTLVPPLALKLFPFLLWRRRVSRATLRADLLAGFVGSLVVLPQAVAYATLAGLPPQYGLYCAMVPTIVAALWGSSWHQVSGPTNTISLAVFATTAPLAAPGSSGYITLVLTLTLLVGLVQVGMGIARLGALVNFISRTVIVGFTAGAGLLIIASQIPNFTGMPVASGAESYAGLRDLAMQVDHVNSWILATGVVTLVIAIVARRVFPRAPYMILAMLAGSAFAYLLDVTGTATVPTVGALPAGLPSLSAPSFDLRAWQTLAPAVLALTVLALAQSVSVSRAVAVKSGQRIDANQEFIGQGLSNLAGAFTSGYVSSGSFNRIWVNYDAGARTPLAAVFSALLLLAIVLVAAPFAAHLPLAVMAALLFVVAWGLIDITDMRRIVRASRAEAVVLAVTFLATLAIRLEFAIFAGVLASLFVYLSRTTRPRLTPVAPDPASPLRRFVPVAELDASNEAECPQLAMLRVDGSLFFGAVEHVRDAIDAARSRNPKRRHLLLVGSGINFIDVAGAELLVEEAKLTREAGGALYLCNLKPPVRELLQRGGFLDLFGREHVFHTKDEAIRAIYGRLDSSRCRVCEPQIFNECKGTLPDGTARTGIAPHEAGTGA